MVCKATKTQHNNLQLALFSPTRCVVMKPGSYITKSGHLIQLECTNIKCVKLKVCKLKHTID